jgi:hypothetical protein
MIKRFSFLLAAFSALVLNSCTKNSSTPTPLPTAFFVIQASPDAPNTDIYINSQLSLQNIPYGTDTGYAFAEPGVYEFKIAETGKTSYYITKAFTFDTAIYNSVFFIDSVNKMKAVAVEDNFKIPPIDSVQIRYLDFSPDLILHTVKFVHTTSSYVYEETGRSFNDQSTSAYRADFTTIKAGTYNIEFYLIGSGTPFKTISNIELSTRKAYTIYMKGFYNGAGTQALNHAVIQHLL